MNFHFLFQRYSTIVIVIAIVGLFVCVSGAASLDWPQWRGTNRDGISTEIGWSSTWSAEGPKQIWKLSIGTGYSSVAVSDGRVYAMGNTDETDTIYCLNADTGAEIWKHSYPCAAKGNGYPGPASTPTVDGKNVYTLSREGHFLCLEADSGAVVWSKHIVKDFGVKSPRWEFASSPLVLDNMVIIDAATALAVDKSTGELIWKTRDYGDSWDDIKSHGGGYSSPYAFNLNGSQRLAIFNSSGLVILDPKTGQEQMLHPWKTTWNVNAATPIVSGDKLFISSGYNSGGALLQISGDKPVVVWKSKNMRNHINSCVLWEGYLYGFDESQLKCLDWETGDLKWAKKGLGKGSLMLADGKLIVLSDKGKLVIAEASPDGYDELASAKVLSGLCWTVPVLANGRIYCANHESDLICLDVRDGS